MKKKERKRAERDTRILSRPHTIRTRGTHCGSRRKRQNILFRTQTAPEPIRTPRHRQPTMAGFTVYLNATIRPGGPPGPSNTRHDP